MRTIPTLKTDLPDYYGTQCLPGLVRIKAEEEAIIWLWANPSIFPWEKPLVWLFSPVTGKTRWPGDLWGIDSCGDLIILENKRGNRKDPFEDFVLYEEECHDEAKAKGLREKWERLYKSEMSRTTCLEVLKRKPGIVPRSSHAAPLNRWEHLAPLIDGQIRGDNYPRNVRSWLDEREKRGNPPPHYVGLVVSIGNNPPELSALGLKSLAKLQRRPGREQIHLFIVRCIKTPGLGANAEISLSQ